MAKKLTFDELVKARAHTMVQAKIHTFEMDLRKALIKLTGKNEIYSHGQVNQPINRLVLVNILDNPNKKWPVKLWEMMEAEVSKDMMATMDMMQQAIVDAGIGEGEDDYYPAKEKEDAAD